jgi:serine/threonine protein kinase
LSFFILADGFIGIASEKIVFLCSFRSNACRAENVLVGSDGLIRLTDFATAHPTGTPCAKPFAGSPQYISPEIVRGGQPTPKVDVFGVGCVAFFLWTGKHAFLRDTDFLTWKAVTEAATTEKNPEKRNFVTL